MQFKPGPADGPVSGFQMRDDDFTIPSRSRGPTATEYRTGMYSGHEMERSHKLNKDPIMELSHVIGY